MKEKIIETKTFLLFWLILAVHFFAIYSKWYLNTHFTNFWLLFSIFSFCMFIIYGVKLEILRNKEDEEANK